MRCEAPDPSCDVTAQEFARLFGQDYERAKDRMTEREMDEEETLP